MAMRKTHDSAEVEDIDLGDNSSSTNCLGLEKISVATSKTVPDPYLRNKEEIEQLNHISSTTKTRREENLIQDFGSCKYNQIPGTLGSCTALQLNKITHSSLSPFQKRVLVALCKVPPGRYTTYKCLASYLSTSPRAVGNVLRINPFAPHVPCHRVLANDGKLGGFNGSWGKGGKAGLHDRKKRALLTLEGVKFDKKGVACGSPWNEFSPDTLK